MADRFQGFLSIGRTSAILPSPNRIRYKNVGRQLQRPTRPNQAKLSRYPREDKPTLAVLCRRNHMVQEIEGGEPS
jgi:hypothetical protein